MSEYFHLSILKEKIQNYAAPLIEKAASMLTSAWETNTLPIPKSMEPPFMRLIRLPQQKELTDVSMNYQILYKNIFIREP